MRVALFRKHQNPKVEIPLIDPQLRSRLPVDYLLPPFLKNRFTQPMGGVYEPQSSENSRVPQKSWAFVRTFYLPNAFIAAGNLQLECGRGGQARQQAQTERVSNFASHQKCLELARIEIQ